MSTRALAWAVRQDLPAVTKMILMTLADNHNPETRQCNPTMKHLTKVTGLDQRTVERHVAKLLATGFLEVKKYWREDRTPRNDYALGVDNDINFTLPEPGPLPPCSTCSGSGCQDCDYKESPLTEPVDTEATEPVD